MQEFKIIRLSESECGGMMSELADVYASAKAFMRKYGNTEQWAGKYPAAEDILQDAREGNLYAVLADNGGIVGCFCFRPSPEPNYSVIEGGRWLNDEPYHVIHRLASNGKAKGVGEAVFRWCLERCANLRVDTHEDNSPMLHLIGKLGFARCGIIYVEDGTPRIAFQRHGFGNT